MTGTRGGLGRIIAMAIVLAVLLLLLCVDAARGGTYEVAQCGWGVGTQLDPAVPPSEGSGFSLADPCAAAPGPGGGVRLVTRPPYERMQGFARARWTAPAGTAIVAVRGVWSGYLQASLRRQLGTVDAGGFASVAEGLGDQPPTAFAATLGAPASAVEFRLLCAAASGGACWAHEEARASLREVTLTLADGTPPSVRVGGALLGPGWHRGTVAAQSTAEDVGAGIAGEEWRLDGTAIDAAASPCATAAIEGELRGTALRPCEPTAVRNLELDTSHIGDGAHLLRACATDFAGNVGCSADAPVEVDNSPPSVQFTGAATGEVAAVTNDPVSGPASGAIAMRRVESPTWIELPTRLDRQGAGDGLATASLPSLEAGVYVFRADVTDAAGNVGESRLRVSGDPAEIRSQLAAGREGGAGSGAGSKGGAAGSHGSRGPGAGGGRGSRGRGTPRLVARLIRGPAAAASKARPAGGSSLTVPFAATPTVRGRLTTDGKGAAWRRVEVVARPARGGQGPSSVAHATTGRDGRFTLRLPSGGPSRSVEVSFPGGGGLMGASAPPLHLRVRAAVAMSAKPSSLRTGETVTIAGRVRAGAGRIPRRGKLVAIQYLERGAGRWRPALLDRTDARGHFALRYRFRYVTGEARIRLRATALPEAGWPYVEGSSPPVTITVQG